MAQKDVGNKIPIYKLKKTDEVMKYYDEWGEGNKYDQDMVDWNYTGPKETSEVLIKYEKNKEAKIYDAGCGTGLVGVELQKYGYSNFYGADLSQKLLDLVPKGLYQKLDKVDLNKPIQEEDNFFDAVMCVGTFTFGHVKPPALDEFIRITKNKGYVCFTINEGIHEEYGFDKKIEQLNKDKKWKEVEFFKSNYIASKDVNAWLGIYEALNFSIKNKNINILKDMLKEWPYFYAMMDMLDMVLAKTDQRIIKFYEECMGDSNLISLGEKLRKQLSTLIYLNRKIIPDYILEQRKEYRDSIRKRNTYAEVLNILQADIMKKIYKKKLKAKDKKILVDAMLVTIAGIAAAMKNVG